MKFPRLLVVLFCSLLPFSNATSSSAAQLMLAPQSLHSSEATFIWHKPAATGAALIHEVLLDGKLLGTTTKTHFNARQLSPGRNYCLSVVTRPASGDAVIRTESFSFRTPPSEPIVSVLDHGAVGDGRTLNTAALQSAIDACPVGGIVLIPEGVFLSGALTLKSNMTLQIAKGGVLKGSTNPKDYLPFNRNRFEGWEMETHASLLNAGTLDRNGPPTLRNLSIRGEGTLSGGGRALSDAIKALYPKKVDGFRARGRLVLLMNAANVEISGLTVEESPCWTLHAIYSENISLHGLTIRSNVHNGDGIDPDSTQNTYIFNCTFDTGDDCIAIKSGKNPEGNVVNRPTENVRIFDCRFERGHGISIGSEMSGGVRGVLVEDCVAGPLLHGLQIKATEERGGYVEDVTVRDCDLRQITVYTKLPYNNDGKAAPAPPFFRNFRFENIDLRKADPSVPVIIVNGFQAAGHETAGVSFENIQLPAGAKIQIDRSTDVTFSRITTVDGTAPAYEITRSQSVSH